MIDKSTIQQEIATLEASGADSVPMEQVSRLLNAVKDLFEGNFDENETELFGELGDLAKFINSAKKELKSFDAGELTDNHIPEASDQLDAIVKMTEKATGSIMDSCEQIQGVHARLRDKLAANPDIDPDTLASVEDALADAEASVTSIFEECNFQDITGQRIMKIVKVLKEIERQILRMVVIFGLRNKEEGMDENTKQELMHDADLLNGPQLEGQGLEQDQIDDILAKLL